MSKLLLQLAHVNHRSKQSAVCMTFAMGTYAVHASVLSVCAAIDN